MPMLAVRGGPATGKLEIRTFRVLWLAKVCFFVGVSAKVGAGSEKYFTCQPSASTLICGIAAAATRSPKLRYRLLGPPSGGGSATGAPARSGRSESVALVTISVTALTAASFEMKTAAAFLALRTLKMI